jgi:hypothetical protein
MTMQKTSGYLLAQGWIIWVPRHKKHVDSLCIAGDGQRTIPEKQVSHEENTFADRF